MKNLILLSGLMLMCVSVTSCEKKQEATHSGEVRVKAVPIEATSIDYSRVYSGTVEESTGTSLSFPVAGTMQKLYVSPGDYVQKGQLIATLDASSLRNAYEIAKATLDQAQDAYNRMKMLHDANSLPDMQWVEVQNTLKQAQSAEAIAKKTMGDANLYSPVSGYVSQKYADAGMNILPGAPIIKVVDISPVKVSISMPENEISAIGQGTTATVRVNALDSTSYVGTLVEKGVTANPLSRSYDVKFQVDNPGRKLLPGMICDVMLDKVSGTSAIIVPTSSVMLDAHNHNFVWLMVDGKATKRNVTVGGMTDAGIIISDGLQPSDSLIVEGMQKVSQGTRVININE